MGNVLCKTRPNRTGSTSNSISPVDRVIGECMQMCPNGIRKKKHFWEKQVFETAPPQDPLQEQPKSQKNGWNNEKLTVPAHPIAPPRKKRTLQRDQDPSNENSFEEICLNDDKPPYNERSVDPPENESIDDNKTNSLTTTNNNKPAVPQKVTRTVSKVGNKKSDKFFGESLSDLSTEYENNTTLESTQTLNSTRQNQAKDKKEVQSQEADMEDKTKESSQKKDDNESASGEPQRESVINLVEDIEEELNRKIVKERGNIMFAMEKHINQVKSATNKDRPEDDERFKDQKPCVEEVIVPVRKIKRHICDDDEKMREIVKSHAEHAHHSPDSITVQEPNGSNLDPSAPKKPQRDFAKYRKSLNGDEFETSQIIEAIQDSDNIVVEKHEEATQTTGKTAVKEKAHHAKEEADKIVKNVKALVSGKTVEQSQANERSKDLPTKSPSKAGEKMKLEMKNFLNTIEKLQTEIHSETNKCHQEVENEAEKLVADVLETAKSSIVAGRLDAESKKNQKDEKTAANTAGHGKQQNESILHGIETKDKVQAAISAPLHKLSEKTSAALKEARLLKEQLKSEILSTSEPLGSALKQQETKTLNENIENVLTENQSKAESATALPDVNQNVLKKEQSVEDCINCMKNDASKTINEVVKFAEKEISEPKAFQKNLATLAANGLQNQVEDEHMKKLTKKPSVVLFEENNTTDFIAELKKEASKTISDVCKYAEKAVNKDVIANGEMKSTLNGNARHEEHEDIVPATPLEVQQKKNLFRPDRVSEITPPTQMQQKVFRRSYSTQSADMDAEKIAVQANEDILNNINKAQKEPEISKSTNNILEKDSPDSKLPPRPARFSEIKKPHLINSEKILRRCLSTQSYLTPNLIEKIALQANILSMPEPEYLGTIDGSSLVSPVCRLESKRSILNSQNSLNSEKTSESESKLSKTAATPPLPPKKRSKEERQKSIEYKPASPTTPSNTKPKTSPQSSPNRDHRNNTTIAARTTKTTSPLTTRSPSPARPSRIPELPKSKLTKRLDRSASRQSFPDLSETKRSQELSETLKQFLSEKDFKPQEILDLIEFEFGNDMFPHLLSEGDRTIINDLKKLAKHTEHNSTSPKATRPRKTTSPLKSASREHLVRQNSQSSDSSSSKKSPDRFRSSRIPVLKNNKISENFNSEFRRHSIDDLDSWFNPNLLNVGEKRQRKRDNSLQLDYNLHHQLMNASLTEKNVAIENLRNQSSRTKSTNDLTNSTNSLSLSISQANDIDDQDHSALLKYLENNN